MKLIELVPKELQDKYGKVFFGEYTYYHDLQDSGYEVNSIDEEYLVFALRDWIEGASDESSNNLYKFKDDLQKIASENDWLKVPVSESIYRLVTVPESKSQKIYEFIEKLIQDNLQFIEDSVKDIRGKLRLFSFCKSNQSSLQIPDDSFRNYTYSANRKIQSWSTSYNATVVFPSERDPESVADFFCVLQKTVSKSDNIFFPNPLLYQIDAEDYSDEEECIRFGNDSIKCYIEEVLIRKDQLEELIDIAKSRK